MSSVSVSQGSNIKITQARNLYSGFSYNDYRFNLDDMLFKGRVKAKQKFAGKIITEAINHIEVDDELSRLNLEREALTDIQAADLLDKVSAWAVFEDSIDGKDITDMICEQNSKFRGDMLKAVKKYFPRRENFERVAIIIVEAKVAMAWRIYALLGLLD